MQILRKVLKVSIYTFYTEYIPNNFENGDDFGRKNRKIKPHDGKQYHHGVFVIF